jgi:acid phosphatase type 7
MKVFAAAVGLVLGALSTLAVAASLPPEQIHIAFAGDSGMSVSWATKGPTDTSTVKYGMDADKLTLLAKGAQKTYYGNEYHHHVELLQLSPGTLYFYSCGDEAQGFSTIRSFKAPAQAMDKAFQTGQPHKISVFGDWGYGEKAHAVETRTALESIKKEVEFVWHVGDLSYADDAFLHYPLHFKYEEIYDNWMNWIENISDSMAYMVAPGNHESECHSPECLLHSSRRKALQNFSAYEARWSMPSQHSGGNTNMWYSFNLGLAHYITIDTETDFPGAAEEHHGDSGVLPAGGFGRPGEFLQWLEQDLKEANANRKVRPWIFVGGHRPIYTNSGTVGVLQKTFEDLMLKYNVDIYFTGHKHHATRSWPIGHNGTVTGHSYMNPEGLVHLVAGGAGCDEYHKPKNHSLPPQLATEVDYLATGVLTIYNSTTLHFDLIQSSDLKVVDSFTMVKEH